MVLYCYWPISTISTIPHGNSVPEPELQLQLVLYNNISMYMIIYNIIYISLYIYIYDM